MKDTTTNSPDESLKIKTKQPEKVVGYKLEGKRKARWKNNKQEQSGTRTAKNMEEQKRVIEKYSSIEAFKNSKYKTMGTFIRFELGLEGYGSR